MVLPPPPADDAPRKVEARWFDALKFALRLSNSGLLLLVDHARQESLGELVEALVPDYPELDVHTDVRRMLELPHGSTVVLVPRVEDADWLNINRPLFSQRELRVVLFCDTQTTIALAQRAVDFFDWISHRVDCPQQPPRFAVERIRTVLAVRAPGIVWTGGNLRAAFAAARPRGTLHEISAALPYPKMVEEVRQNRRAWIAWTDIDSHFRLRRVRWAHAEAAHRTRAILVEPTVASPGWWHVHGRMTDVHTARQQLEQTGVRLPGRAAALLDFAPEALAQLNETRLAKHDKVLDGLEAFQGNAVPWTLPSTRLRQHCLQEFNLLTERMAENQPLEHTEAASWAAWFPSFRHTTMLVEEPWRSLDKAHRPSAMEVLLARTFDAQLKLFELSTFALQLYDLDVADYWALRAPIIELPGAQNTRAFLIAMRGEPQARELFLREGLRTLAHKTQDDIFHRNILISHLAESLGQQKKWSEVEELLQPELAPTSSPPSTINPEHRNFAKVLAAALRNQGKYAEAEVVIRGALDRSSSRSNDERIELGLQLEEWAYILTDTQREHKAESALNEAYSLLRGALGFDHPDPARVLNNLSRLLCRLGRTQEAESKVRQALAELKKQQQEGGPVHAQLMYSLSYALASQGKYSEAETALSQALHLYDILHTGSSESNELMRYELATLLLLQGRYQEAAQLLRRIISINQHNPSLRASLLRPALFQYGHLLWRQGRAAEAEPYFARAVEILKEAPFQAAPLVFEHLDALASVQAEINSPHAPSTAREALTLIGQTSKLAASVTQDVIDGLEAIAQQPMDPSPT